MSETYNVNGHTYRAYPTHYFCDGVEITPAQFYAAIKSLYGHR